MTQMHTGLSDNERAAARDILHPILASEFFLYVRTLNYHWNVTGENFLRLHAFFESQYETLKEVVDELAERMRALGFVVHVDVDTFKQIACVDEGKSEQNAQGMIKSLIDGHEKVVQLLRKSTEKLGELHDYASEDILVGLLKIHEKQLWMLRSH